MGRACRILDELAPMGIIPDSAFEDMLNVLCKAGRVKEACKLADGIVDRGREIPGKGPNCSYKCIEESRQCRLSSEVDAQ